MSITIYTADGRTKQFKIDKFLRKAVTEWLGYPAVKFYTTENGEDETNTFSPDDVVFAIPYTPDKSLDDDIFKACKKGDVEKVEDLISRCADVNATNENLNTPLHYASLFGHRQVVTILLNNGADINAKNDQMKTPLHNAASIGKYLHNAASIRQYSICALLMSNGARIENTPSS